MGTAGYRRKKTHKGDHPMSTKYKTKRRTKDLDQVQDDLKPGKVQKLMNQEEDLDKPGSAQHYCVHCAHYFINEAALKDHMKGKPHKKRVKALKTEAFTQKESERCAGMGSYVPPKKISVDLPEKMDSNSENVA